MSTLTPQDKISLNRRALRHGLPVLWPEAEDYRVAVAQAAIERMEPIVRRIMDAPIRAFSRWEAQENERRQAQSAWRRFMETFS